MVARRACLQPCDGSSPLPSSIASRFALPARQDGDDDDGPTQASGAAESFFGMDAETVGSRSESEFPKPGLGNGSFKLPQVRGAS